MLKPDFKETKKEWTLEEKVIIRFHNNRIYISDFIQQSSFIFHNNVRTENETLKRLNDKLVTEFEQLIISLIENDQELKKYYEVINRVL